MLWLDNKLLEVIWYCTHELVTLQYKYVNQLTVRDGSWLPPQ
jgi:hypothetical protein